MRLISKEEFEKAVRHATEGIQKSAKKEDELIKARQIFHNLTDKNISYSYEMYQKVLMDDIAHNVVDELSGMPYRNEIDYFLEYFKVSRPSCPECGGQLRIGYLNTHRSNSVEGYNTYWYCIHNDSRMCVDGMPSCDYCGDFTKLSPFELAAETINATIEGVVKKGCGGCNG